MYGRRRERHCVGVEMVVPVHTKWDDGQPSGYMDRVAKRREVGGEGVGQPMGARRLGGARGGPDHMGLGSASLGRR